MAAGYPAQQSTPPPTETRCDPPRGPWSWIVPIESSSDIESKASAARDRKKDGAQGVDTGEGPKSGSKGASETAVETASSGDGAPTVGSASGTWGSGAASSDGSSDESGSDKSGSDESGGPGIALWIATAGGVGFGPWAPGTWGALLAVGLFALLFHRLGTPLYVLLVLGICGAGTWASSQVESYFGRKDDGRVVIDEVAGQLIALIPVVPLRDLPLSSIRLPGFQGGSGAVEIDIWWVLVVTGFVAFRWFDIRKPGPVKWAEDRFESGWGVMADDLVAGVLAAFIVMLPAYMVVVAQLQSMPHRLADSGVVEIVAWLVGSGFGFGFGFGFG